MQARIPRAAGAVVAALMLSGCGSLVPANTANTERSAAPPAFSGPFAADLTAAWVESESDFVRAALDDQVVSDDEWRTLSARMASCLDDAGIRFEGFEEDGTYSTSPILGSPQEIDATLTECENWSGERWLHPLRRSMSSNPSNAPFEDVMTECLVRNDLVPPDYSSEDFVRDNPSLNFPFMGTPDEAAFWSCNSDPSFRRDEGSPAP